MLPNKNAFINKTNRTNLYSIHSGYNCSSSTGDWILVQKTGTISFRLGTTDPTFIGSEGCDINIQSPSVEKRHAVLHFDRKSTQFTVKDLQSSAGTYLNEQRLPPQAAARFLNHMDLLRFGYDSNVYEIRSGSGQHHTSPTGDGPLSDRLRRISDIAKAPTTIANNMNTRLPLPPTTSSSADRFCRHNPAVQGVRGLSGSGVISPSFTLDSGHGSSSTPSSPVKEMSPLPNSVSSSTASPTPPRKMLKDGLEEFLLTRSNSHQFLNNTGSGLKSSRSLCGSKNEIRIRKDSLENVMGDGKGKVVNLAPECQGTAESYADALLILESDLTVPNEVFQPQQQSLLMSSGRNSPGPKSNVPDVMLRSRSFSGGETAELSSLYGTPHWWPNERTVSRIQENNISFHRKSGPEFLQFGKDTTENQGEDRCLESEPTDKSDSDLLGNKKPSPMAFTVDFGGADTKKCFGIADSISRFAPRHRRNLSLTKPEEVMGSKTEEQRNVTSNVLKNQRKASLGAESNGCNKLSGSNGISSSGENYIKENDRRVDERTLSLAVGKKESKLNSYKPKAAIMPTSSSAKHRLNTSVNLQEKKGIPTMNNSESNKCSSVNPSGVDDTTSEAGTYTIKTETEEVKNARNSIDCVFGTEGNKLGEFNYNAGDKESSNPASLAWVREWAESAAQMQMSSSSPTDVGAETETRFFLQETENLVSAMQERVSQNMKSSSRQNSDSEDELYRQREKLLRKPHTKNENMTSLRTRSSPLFRESSVLSDSGYALGYASDNSSNEGSKETRTTGMKYNRAFGTRQNRAIGYDSDGCTPKNRQSMTLPVRGVSPRPQVGTVVIGRPPLPSPSPPPLSRNDGGRFSLRISHKSKAPSNAVTPTASLATAKADTALLGLRANNLFSSAAKKKSDLGLKKQMPDRNVKVIRKSPASAEPRSNSTLTSKEVEFENWKRRKSYNPMRAAAQGKRKDEKSVRDDGGGGDDPNQSDTSASMIKSTSYVAGRFITGNSEDEDFSYEVDEIESSPSNSPSHFIMSKSHHDDNTSALAHQNVRSKNKLEALDNLVIATIHSLSSKVRTSSRCLLEKLQLQHCNDENGALLEEMVSQLKDLESIGFTNSSPTKNSSRELSGTLKNLKKLEQVILVLDRVLCDDDSETN